MVAQVENHEGLAESAVRSAEARLSRARRALEGASVERARLDREAAAQLQLELRARDEARTAANDFAALEALRRARRLGRIAAELQNQRAAYHDTIVRLEGEVGRIGDQLVALQRERHLLRARQERAEALEAVLGNGNAGDGLRAALERWEAQVNRVEAESQTAFDVSRIYEAPDDTVDELLAELAELRRKP
jgi:phage shock protein A